MKPGVSVSLLILTFGLLGASCATGPAAPQARAEAPRIFDTLEDFSKMYSHSADLGFDTKNPAAFPNGDGSRIFPANDKEQEIVYKLDDIADFRFTVGYYTYQHKHDPSKISFAAEISKDGKDWVEVATKAEAADNGCFLFTTYSPAQAVAPGANYLRFRFADKDLGWSTEISQIEVIAR